MREKLKEHIKKNFIYMSLRLALYSLAWIGIIYILALLMPEKGTHVIMWWVATALYAGIFICDGVVCFMHWFWDDVCTMRMRYLKNFDRYKPICKYCNPPKRH